MLQESFINNLYRILVILIKKQFILLEKNKKIDEITYYWVKSPLNDLKKCFQRSELFDSFTLNFSEDNEIENVIFDKDYEYAVTGLKINVKLPEGQVIKIEDEKKLDQKSKKIQEIIK